METSSLHTVGPQWVHSGSHSQDSQQRFYQKRPAVELRYLMMALEGAGLKQLVSD